MPLLLARHPLRELAELGGRSSVAIYADGAGFRARCGGLGLRSAGGVPAWRDSLLRRQRLPLVQVTPTATTATTATTTQQLELRHERRGARAACLL
jgi:hypothetical protein